jgi:hypothetical protein
MTIAVRVKHIVAPLVIPYHVWYPLFVACIMLDVFYIPNSVVSHSTRHRHLQHSGIYIHISLSTLKLSKCNLTTSLLYHDTTTLSVFYSYLRVFQRVTGRCSKSSYVGLANSGFVLRFTAPRRCREDVDDPSDASNCSSCPSPRDSVSRMIPVCCSYVADPVACDAVDSSAGCSDGL